MRRHASTTLTPRPRGADRALHRAGDEVTEVTFEVCSARPACHECSPSVALVVGKHNAWTVEPRSEAIKQLIPVPSPDISLTYAEQIRLLPVVSHFSTKLRYPCVMS